MFGSERVRKLYLWIRMIQRPKLRLQTQMWEFLTESSSPTLVAGQFTLLLKAEEE